LSSPWRSSYPHKPQTLKQLTLRPQGSQQMLQTTSSSSKGALRWILLSRRSSGTKRTMNCRLTRAVINWVVLIMETVQTFLEATAQSGMILMAQNTIARGMLFPTVVRDLAICTKITLSQMKPAVLVAVAAWHRRPHRRLHRRLYRRLHQPPGRILQDHVQ